VKWKKSEYIDIKTKHGTKKKLMIVDKTTKAGDMIKYIIKILRSFVDGFSKIPETIPAFILALANVAEFVHD
jgi:hypothetical protein